MRKTIAIRPLSAVPKHLRAGRWNLRKEYMTGILEVDKKDKRFY